MEKRAVISEEDTPDLEKKPVPGTPEYTQTLEPYQQKIAKILGSNPVKLEDLEANHPVSRLVKGAGFKPRLPKGDPRNKVR